MTDPYKKGMFKANPYAKKKPLEGNLVVILDGKYEQRGLQLIPQPSRCLIANEVHEIILTDEDPRKEDSTAILKEIAAGCSNKTENLNLFLINNRPKAIRKAFSLAKKDDLVLLLGKGHENSIIYNETATPYNEIEEAKSALKEMGYSKHLEENL